MICLNNELRILHLNDLHFGIEGRNYHNGYLNRTKKYVKWLISDSKPDLIVAGGDNILSTGINGLSAFCDYMDSFKINWTFVFGNHDCEDKYYQIEYIEFLVNYSKKSLYLIYADSISADFSIKIYNNLDDKLIGSLIIMDSGVHNGTTFEGVSKEQVKWYEEEIDILQKEYNGNDIIKTILFTHMQSPEFYNAYKESNEFIINQDLCVEDIEEIKNGAPQIDGGLFDSIISKQSTKAYFVAHAHILNFQCIYKGILLGFGPQSGHCKLFKNDDELRETYLYVLDKDLNIKTISYKENLEVEV